MDISMNTVLTGVSVMGGLASNDPAIMAGVCVGTYDELFSIMFYHKEYDRLPTSLAEAKEDPATQSMVTKIKGYTQHIVKTYVHEEELKLKNEAKKEHMEFLNTFNNSNKPAPEGTVSELSEKYGVSKKQIRRLKRENNLHTLTEGDKL